jgi:hypothetical protein
MTSQPCFEILGLSRDSEHAPVAIDNAYHRLKTIIGADIAMNDDLDSAYETLRNAQSRSAYILNWTPFKESEWTWKMWEDEDGVWRSLIRRTKDRRTDEWASSDDKGRRDIKKQKQNDRKGNRDKRRGGGGGYDD